MSASPRGRLAALGPGLLWAGTAVGVSHLVQSTRAGAGYGLTLLWLVILANATKYPAFEAGPRYTAATGRSLLDAYRLQGRWVLAIFLLQTLVTMCIVEAAVTIVTAGMASVLISDALSVTAWSAVMIGASAGVLVLGRFKALDLVMKAMMVLLSVSTVAAVALLLPTVDPSRLTLWPPLPELSPVHIGFLVALVGWMPAPFDTAVWHSAWAVEKGREEGRADLAEARFDFHVGYIGTALLAMCFMFLGAAVLFRSGNELPVAAPAFAALLVDVYAQALGEWARPLILVAAFTTMTSTTFAVTDGFPRAISGAVARWRGPEGDGEDRDPLVYWGTLGLLAVGALAIIEFFAADLKGLVDMATTVSFVIAPVLAVFNLRAVTAPEVPPAMRPGPVLLAAHYLCLAALVAFTFGYLSTLL